jgi:hypothetical protein
VRTATNQEYSYNRAIDLKRTQFRGREHLSPSVRVPFRWKWGNVRLGGDETSADE